MHIRFPLLPATLAIAALATTATGGEAASVALSDARVYIEFNQTADDLGYHVKLDGEDWRRLAIRNPAGKTVFHVKGKRGYQLLGMTELFFEGAEPNLSEFPLEELLALFPEGVYEFRGKTVDGDTIGGEATLSHAVPNGPANVVADVGPGDSLVVSWDPVTTHPDGFPSRPIDIVAYEVIVKPFDIVVPASVTSVTVPPEFVATIPAGTVLFEVLAIDASGNQSITESSFVKP